MTTLTAVLTHLEPSRVHESFELLYAVAPQGGFVVCYGGKRSDFDRIDLEDKVFIDDPTLRGPEQHLQSLTRVFEELWSRYLHPDTTFDSLYLIEYDHLILDANFDVCLRQLAETTRADLLGKNCGDRTATNDEHYIRFRSDRRLLAHLRKLSVRDDPTRIFGCLGDGIWLSRRAVQAYVEVGTHPPCYCETYVPTLLHHLGLHTVNIDAHSDLYRDVRWTPAYSEEEAVDRVRRGAVFIHPVKDRDAIRAAGRAALAKSNGSSEPRGAVIRSTPTGG